MKPFIKWAGGKSFLIPTAEESLAVGACDYIEPFVGGGSIFFHIQKYLLPEQRVLLNDINRNLILAYKAVKERPRDLIEVLNQIGINVTEKSYNNIRELFNYETDDFMRACLFVYLNKTCFNGLYRENSKGEFNVSWNKKETISFDEEVIMDCSKALVNTELTCLPFQDVVKSNESGKKRFYFLDPPYLKINEGSFTKYSKDDFTEKDHQELARLCSLIDQRGDLFMLTNSSSPVTRSLYGQYKTKTVSSPRKINSDGKGRNKVDELVITNYDWET